MKNLMFLISIAFVTLSSYAQQEAGFIMNGLDIRMNKANPQIVETYGYFMQDPKTQVKSYGSSGWNKEITNVDRGIYMFSAIGQTVINGVPKNYPQDIMEAKFSYGNEATLTKTYFSPDAVPSSRINCKTSTAFGAVFGRKGRKMNCFTATPELCTKIEKLKSKFGDVDFNKLSDDLKTCSNTLNSLNIYSNDLNEYVRSKDYKDLSDAQSKNMKEFLDNKGEEFKFKKVDGINRPDDVQFFAGKSLAGTRDLQDLVTSLNNLAEVSTACAAMVDAGRVVNEVIDRKTAVDPITGGILIVKGKGKGPAAAVPPAAAEGAPARK